MSTDSDKPDVDRADPSPQRAGEVPAADAAPAADPAPTDVAAPAADPAPVAETASAAEAGGTAASAAMAAGVPSSWPIVLATAAGGFAALLTSIAIAAGVVTYIYRSQNEKQDASATVAQQAGLTDVAPSDDLPVAETPPAAEIRPAASGDSEPEENLAPASLVQDESTDTLPPETAEVENTSPEETVGELLVDPFGEIDFDDLPRPSSELERPPPTGPDLTDPSVNGDGPAPNLPPLFGEPEPVLEGEPPVPEDDGGLPERAALVDAEGRSLGDSEEEPLEDHEDPFASLPDNGNKADLDESDEVAIVPNTDPPAPPPPALPPDPFEWIDRHNELLSIPAQAPKPAQSTEPEAVATILVDDPTRCRLFLVGSAQVVRADQKLELILRDDEGSRCWEVQVKTVNSLAPQPVGTFALADRNLVFQWARKAPAGLPLEHCMLRVVVDDDYRICRLSRPLDVAAVEIRFDKAYHRVYREIPAATQKVVARLVERKELRVEIWTEGFPECEEKEFAQPRSASTTTAARQTTYQIQDATISSEASALDVAVRVTVARQGVAVEIAKSYFPPVGVDRDGTPSAVKANAQWRGSMGEHALEDLLAACTKAVTEEKAIQSKQNNLKRELQALVKSMADVHKFRPDEYAGGQPSRAELEEKERKLQTIQKEMNEKHADLRRAELKWSTHKKQHPHAESQQQWCQRVQRLFRNLENNGTVHFRIYFELGGKQFDLIRTAEQT